MYYLETNSIRTQADKLLRKNYLDNCYTSILSICELLSGIINNETFNQRRGILKKVYDSKILADLDMPEAKIHKAYGRSFDNLTNDNIILLGLLCISSKSYSDFLNDTQKSPLAETWYFLKVYDENSTIKFKESFQNRQNIFDYSEQNIKSDFEGRWNNLTENKNLRERILNDLIIYFAESLLSSVPDRKEKYLKDLIRAYDHSLDIYFLCVGYFSGTKIVFKNSPGKNDFFDLYHLMYLRNISDIIVSNDTMLLKLMNKIHPNNILPTDDFEKIIEKR